jgi:hypothetical protein
MRSWTLTAVLACVLSTVAHGQRPVPHPEVLAGPWELTDTSGIDGFFLSFGTHAQGTAEQPVITNQTVSIRVYHRQNGDETWGWYSPARSGPADAASVFDGQHLRIGNDRTGLRLDVTFDAGTLRWTGTWPRDGQRRDVVLERPHPLPNVPPSPFTGDWDGLPEATRLNRQTRLHVAQSSDQAFTIWMDRFMMLIDQRHGELLRLESVDHDTIALETTNTAGVRDRYQATLSADGSTLVGTWRGVAGVSGRTLNASSAFRRVP